MDRIREFYEQKGYYVCPNLIPHPLIDRLLEQYKGKIVASSQPFFRQSSNRWSKNSITEHGYVVESFLNVHDYPKFPDFSELAKQIYCLPAVREVLTQLTGHPEHNLVQSMLFDLNTKTPAHTDSYYTDSIPYGHLLGGWFALEDIHEDAGRFYVVPQSNFVEFELTEEERLSNGPYMKKVREYLDNHLDEIHAPALKKGDVLFWNSKTVHGSLETCDPKHSRKSLTAHYLPSQYPFGSRYATSPIPLEYSNYDGMRCMIAPDSRKNYSLVAKLKTDLQQYVWYRPKLIPAYNLARKAFAKLSGK